MQEEFSKTTIPFTIQEARIHNARKFDGLINILKDEISTGFEREKYINPFTCLVTKKGQLIDFEMDSVARVIAFDRKIPVERAAPFAYSLFSTICTEASCIGYIDVTQAYCVKMNIEHDPLKAEEDELDEAFSAMVEKYGERLEDVPTKKEVVLIRCRFRSKRRIITWGVKRNERGVWLDGVKDEIMRSQGHGAFSVLDEAIDEALPKRGTKKDKLD